MLLSETRIGQEYRYTPPNGFSGKVMLVTILPANEVISTSKLEELYKPYPPDGVEFVNVDRYVFQRPNLNYVIIPDYESNQNLINTTN